MPPYSQLCDDFFLNVSLNTEMPLPTSRETVLEFFGRMRKSYPQMRHFITRDSGDHVLEEDKDNPAYRWVSLESRRVCSGAVNPDSIDAAMQQHALAMSLAPYMLSVSALDCDAIDVLFGFDFTYRGNHNELIADTLGVGGGLDGLHGAAAGRTLSCEPSLTIALDAECRRQARISFGTRTGDYHVRRGDYPEEQISIYLTVRQYGALDQGDAFENVIESLRETAEDLVNEHMAGQILRPLQSAIATR